MPGQIRVTRPLSDSDDVILASDFPEENPQTQNLGSWLEFLSRLTDEANHNLKAIWREPGPSSVYGSLSNESAKSSLATIAAAYERAIQHFPSSYKLWRDYLRLRSSFVLGNPAKPVNIHSTKRRNTGEDDSISLVNTVQELCGVPSSSSIVDHDIDMGPWLHSLHPYAGYHEWVSLCAAHERALIALPNMPRIWLSYLTILLHPQCPPNLSGTHARRTFDRSLRVLAPPLHRRIWPLYLSWSLNEVVPSATTSSVWMRYLNQDPLPAIFYIEHVLLGLSPPRPLEACKRLLLVARKAAAGHLVAFDGRSPLQIFSSWVELCLKHAELVGQDPPEPEENIQRLAEQNDSQRSRIKLIPVDPESDDRLPFEEIVRDEGIAIYPDKAGFFWTSIAAFWIRRGEFDHAERVYEDALSKVMTLKDFSQVFDAYGSFLEQFLSSLMDAAADEPDDEDTEEIDEKLAQFQALMDKRPFLVNDVMLRRSPNDVLEWQKRIHLFEDNPRFVQDTFESAFSTINVQKAQGIDSLWIQYANFKAKESIDAARAVYERAVQQPFAQVDELAKVWTNYADLELTNGDTPKALILLQRATKPPEHATSPADIKAIRYHDNALPAKTRLFKSLSLWSFYVDVTEALGNVKMTCRVYDKIIELKIANAQTFVNYANFLMQNKYYEDAFRVYERAIDLLTYPIVFEIWNIYLAKFIERYRGTKVERTRDLFEQAIKNCPKELVKALFIMYAQFEQDHGLARRTLSVLERAVDAVHEDDRLDVFLYHIAKATSMFGLPAARPIYEKAIATLPRHQAVDMSRRYAQLEAQLGENDRARGIFVHASLMADPQLFSTFWDAYREFEISSGDESSFKEFLRLRRASEAANNTESSYASRVFLQATHKA